MHNALKAVFFAVLCLLIPGAALAQERACTAGTLCIDLNPRNFKPMPIGVLDFGGEIGPGQQVAMIISANLKRSGLFEPIDRARFPEASVAFDAAPNFQPWAALGVQAVINGRVIKDGARLSVEYRLWDVGTGQQVVGQKHAVDPSQWRRLAHLASDVVFERLTGDKGFFDTRIVFVDETGSKEKRRKRLAIIDQDGANFRAISSGDELLVTPRFSPQGDRVTFMAFAQDGKARVQVLDLASGRRDMVGKGVGMSFSPRFSPDGTAIVMSVEQNGNTNLVLAESGGKTERPLTNGSAIDTSPSFSPDGAQIAFESDRGGGQQIYVMGADGSNARRISFGEGRYSTPVWSPKGDYIAFTKQKGGTFAIGIMKPDGQGERILTEGFHNEGPSWAPNGRYLTFFREAGSGSKLFMVDITGRVEVPIPTPSFASDPAWSPLLSQAK
jgi:TolB protein